MEAMTFTCITWRKNSAYRRAAFFLDNLKPIRALKKEHSVKGHQDMDTQHYLVVGGSSGIGLEISRRLYDKGHAVTVGSRSADRITDLDGLQHLKFDVTAPSLQLDGLPAVLNGIAYCPGTIRLKPFQRLTPEDFMEDVQINYMGAVKVIQACLPRLKKSRTGASILLFSTVAVGTGMPFHASIAGAKGAVEGLTRSLAAELAPRIRVNAIAPSLTDTPLARDLLSSDEKRQTSENRHPLKRIGTPQEIARLAAYLLSEDGAWMTGQILHVDGGMSALRTFR
jgi:NAD(P)-dependent dehydrogenase (short-subunit alcohol dehydrogenase family)